ILLLEHFLIAWRRLSLVWYECKDSVLSTGVIAAVVWLFVSCLFYEFENPPSAAAVEDSPFDSGPALNSSAVKTRSAASHQSTGSVG
ncbi:hypothetical protein FOZ63_004090, partial [Perkinsus olseni]